MSSLVFFMDHLPLLCRSLNKSAIIVYFCLEKFKNDQGIVQITYGDLREHLGFSSSTIQKSLAVLKRINLIEEIDSGVGKIYRILPVDLLDDQIKQSLLEESKVEDYGVQTNLRKRYLEEDYPLEFQQLLNKKLLQKIFKELGTLKKPKEICVHLKLDFHTFKLLCERTGKGSFKETFEKLVLEIESEGAKKLKKFSQEEKDLANYLYDKLKDLGIKPTNKSWYMKNCNIAKTILENITLEEAKEVLDWGFNDSWWSDKISDLTPVHTLYARYKLSKKKPSNLQGNKITRSTPLPEEVIEAIATLAFSFPVRTYEDAFILKQSVLDGQDKPEIVKAVEILENYGIIPSGSENLKFG